MKHVSEVCISTELLRLELILLCSLQDKIAQPGTLNLSAPEVASAQRAYPISEPPSPNNRHRMRSKSKDNQLHSEIINFRRNRNNNTNTASNDASSNANSGSSITEEQ